MNKPSRPPYLYAFDFGMAKRKLNNPIRLVLNFVERATTSKHFHSEEYLQPRQIPKNGHGGHFFLIRVQFYPFL